jgi:transcriptional regulator with XRE-family HTH domain
VTATAPAIGDLLREWRRRRRLSQLELAAVADVSARHVCFLETGRAKPSRDMLLRLAEHLQVPLRERNVLLNAAGFSSIFTERPLADADFDVVRKAIDRVLLGHEPFPAFAVDRHWMLVASNGGFKPFLGGIDPTLLRPPVNVLRLTLSPLGLGTRLANYQQWRSHVLDKLAGQIRASADPVLVNLRNELLAYPLPPGPVDPPEPPAHEDWHKLVVPFQLRTETGILSFYSTTTIFGTPIDITLSEISLESFYPADTATIDAMRNVAAENLPPR